MESSFSGFCGQRERQTKFDNLCLPSWLNLFPFLFENLVQIRNGKFIDDLLLNGSTKQISIGSKTGAPGTAMFALLIPTNFYADTSIKLLTNDPDLVNIVYKLHKFFL